MVEKRLAGATREDGRPGPLNDGTNAQILNVIAQVLDYALEERAIPRLAKSGRIACPSGARFAAPTYSPDEQTRLLASST
jgi:hypothetical protein